MNMIQAQDRFINRINSCHPGHYNRVYLSARKELWNWAIKKGYTKEEARIIIEEAHDIAKLNQISED